MAPICSSSTDLDQHCDFGLEKHFGMGGGGISGTGVAN